jgi:hypothetical protein
MPGKKYTSTHEEMLKEDGRGLRPWLDGKISSEEDWIGGDQQFPKIG